MSALDTKAFARYKKPTEIAVPMQSPDENQLWCPGQSLWSLITEHVPLSELPKIRTVLGHSLVDMYTEVHTEAEMWHRMWQESQQGINSSRAGTPLPRQQGFPLADPPAIKELVRAEVKMLLQTLRDRARLSRGGRDSEELLFRYKPETVDYALGYLDSCHRSCSSPGDTDHGSRPSSHCSLQSSAEDEIETMRDKLNVTDIDQVVDRLRSVLMQECEALNTLIKHLKGNMKQKCRSQSEFHKSEPTLAELKELRGAIQMDLKLYPSSFATSPPASPLLPVKDLKNRFRRSAIVSDDTLQASSTTPALRPHPPPPLCHTKPRPPLGAPPSKTSVKLINNSSLSRTHGPASSGPRKTQTPICNRITTSGHADCHSTTSLSRPGSDQIMAKTINDCSLSPEQDRAGLCCRVPTSSPGFEIKTPRNSPIHETQLSSRRHIHRKCDLSQQMERTSSPAWRSRHINTIPSSPPRDAGFYSSNCTDHSVSTTGKSQTQNGRQSNTCGGSLLSTRVQTDKNKRKSTSVMSEAGSLPAQTSSRNSNNGTDHHLGKDVTKQQSLVASCTHREAILINGQFFTSLKRPLEGTIGQPKSVQEAETELEFNKFCQLAPPARVST